MKIKSLYFKLLLLFFTPVIQSNLLAHPISGSIRVNAVNWGATPNDNTDDTEAIQNAIDYVSSIPGGAGGTVFLPSGKYLLNPDQRYCLRIKTHVCFDLTDNVILTINPTNLDNYEIIRIYGEDNVIVRGATIIGDRDKHIQNGGSYNNGGMGICIMGMASNVILENVTVKDCWGDGFYIGIVEPEITSINIKVINCKAINNRRNGLSLTNVDGVVIDGGSFENTNGAAPEAGIDIEADGTKCLLKNIIIKNVKTSNNAGAGIEVACGNLTGRTDSITLKIESWQSDNDGRYGSLFFVGGDLDNNTLGTISVKNSQINYPVKAGVTYYSWGIKKSPGIEFSNVYVTTNKFTYSVHFPSTINDFDGDHISDIYAKFDNTENWKIDRSGYSGFAGWDYIGLRFGGQSAHPVPADYDGDGLIDISVKTDVDGGYWYIDYASDGFDGGWDWIGSGFGNHTAHAVPADYDGDGKVDLSVKTDDGYWFIDYAYPSFEGGWDWGGSGFGNNTAHPVPADYDGDGKADLSVKTDDGRWLIDYSAEGFEGGWKWSSGGYLGSTAHAVPADYDGDGKADLSVKTDDGYWYIDYASDRFEGGWDWGGSGFGNFTAHPVPADYDGDGRADLSVKTDNGYWLIDYRFNGFEGGWNDVYYYETFENTQSPFKSLSTVIPKAFDNVALDFNTNYKILSIYDLNGRCIRSINRTCSLNYLIHYSNLPNGIYFVQVIQNSTVLKKKIFIMH